MEVRQVFEGVYKIDRKLATKNLIKGNKVYDEELVDYEGEQYRLWNPYRSKLAAAILNGLKDLQIRKGSKVLYLGAATGTTSSHVSDIVGRDGIVYCIEISERNMRELLKACESRENMLPMLQDARNTEAYSADTGTCDVLYQDIAARDQADILLRNAELLKKGAHAYVAIKSQSIDVTRAPELVFKGFLEEVSAKFKVLEKIDIAPYSKMHLFVALQKK
ncbi:MAG: fibrillarin-like rRNA/tRNA 2'-O-methyltransferase [Candidatus Micrarchaeota archaeon]|nr:fibrillarin-like rRNA/tRNA 2'-O-methyltransferase [Candidatus Micrarchaeota archaeon]